MCRIVHPAPGVPEALI
jgi:phytochrome B